jgi:lipopolysaccharide export system protein LptC
MKLGVGAYSKLVSYAKIGLPLVAVMLLGTVFFVTSPDDFNSAGLTFTEADKLALRDGLHIVNPTISGATDMRHTYLFRADSMYSSTSDKNLVFADTLSGEIALASGKTVSLAGDAARLDLAAETFHLTGGATVSTSDGYKAQTEGLLADLKAGSVVSDGPVLADGPVGHVEAGLLRITTGLLQDENSENTVITFENGVRVVFQPPLR